MITLTTFCQDGFWEGGQTALDVVSAPICLLLMMMMFYQQFSALQLFLRNALCKPKVLTEKCYKRKHSVKCSIVEILLPRNMSSDVVQHNRFSIVSMIQVLKKLF